MPSTYISLILCIVICGLWKRSYGYISTELSSLALGISTLLTRIGQLESQIAELKGVLEGHQDIVHKHHTKVEAVLHSTVPNTVVHHIPLADLRKINRTSK